MEVAADIDAIPPPRLLPTAVAAAVAGAVVAIPSVSFLLVPELMLVSLLLRLLLLLLLPIAGELWLILLEAMLPALLHGPITTLARKAGAGARDLLLLLLL